MCEANAYFWKNEEEELIIKDVAKIFPKSSGYQLITILGEKKEVEGRLKEIDLLEHKILFEKG